MTLLLWSFKVTLNVLQTNALPLLALTGNLIVGEHTHILERIGPRLKSHDAAP